MWIEPDLLFGLFEINLIQPSPIQIETLSLSQKNLSQCQDHQSQDVLRDLQGLNQGPSTSGIQT